jgi:predicted DsbA family dithiol-disulfide isomerase
MDCDENGVCLPANKPGKQPPTGLKPSEAKTDDSAGKQVIDIECISDVIWPWCYVGKRRLEQAVALLDSSKVKVNFVWRPFELDPTLPLVGKNKMEHYYSKFGKQRTDSMIPQMKETGKTAGINFSYGGKVGNTLNAHRVIQLAKQRGKADEAMQAFFTAYFEEERDITDKDVLANAAVESGTCATKEEALKFIASNEMRSEVKEEIRQAYNEGVSGVPHFIINRKLSVSGGQPAEQWTQIFKQLGATK